MGLFGGGNSTNETTERVQSQNSSAQGTTGSALFSNISGEVNFDDLKDPIISGGGNNNRVQLGGTRISLQQTDQGAVRAGRDIALGALDTVERSSRDAFGFADRFGDRALSDSFGFADRFGDRALSDSFGFGRRALDTADDASSRAFDVSMNALDAIERSSSMQLGAALSFANRASTEALDFANNATRSDQQLNTETLIKYAAGLAAVATLAVAFG